MNRLFAFFLILMALLEWNCSGGKEEQAGLDQLAVSWKLISNQVADSPRYRAAFTFTNKGPAPIRGEEWSLYFSQTPRAIAKGSIDGPADLQQINGDLYKLQPAAGFNLFPGDSLTITYEGDAWLIKETDAPIGLFFVSNGSSGTPRTVPVKTYSIWPFDRPEQYSRHLNDKTPFPDAAWTFDRNARLKKLDQQELLPIIPTPRTIEKKTGSFSIDGSTTIYFAAGLEKEASFIREALAGFLPAAPGMQSGTPAAGEQGIVLNLAPTAFSVSPEAYALDIREGRLLILGNSPAGVFYGTQSVLALIPVGSWGAQTETLTLPAVSVQDAPQFGYRGIHLDIARNFNDQAAIKKLMDVMAFYKLNKLHLHLTDDEGWRLEIPGLPELTEVGAQRGFTEDESDRLNPAYGSGSGSEKNYGSGYLRRGEFIELLQYAAQRHIEVIPELNVPGHARAAIKAMEARYHRLSGDNAKELAEEFRLADPGDRSSYLSAQHYNDNVICVCCESTYQFYEKVVDEVRAMFTEANVPLTTIHTGGDEVPQGVWTASPACEALISQDENINGVEDLPTYFFSRINRILLDRGLKSAGWEEVVMKKTEDGWIPHPDFVDRQVIPYVWNNLSGNQDLGYRLANAGYPVVLCDVTNLYFDLAYNKDPREPGFYWGGFVDTRKAFDFRPLNIYESTTQDAMGNTFDPETDYREMERLNPNSRNNILGIQGELWSETIKGPDMLEYYYLPKLLGLAERAWALPLPAGEPTDEAWEVFANTLGQRELKRLDHLSGGYNYRLPPPGAMVTAGKVAANVAFPGLSLRYTVDGSEPGPEDPLYSEPVPLDSLVCFKTFDQQGRSSRMVCVGP